MMYWAREHDVSFRALEILTMTCGAREHDESLRHIIEKTLMDNGSWAFTDRYTHGRQ